jgi:ATP-dependent DNA helicase PIF1
MALNSEQLAAVDCIASGHNLLLLGAAGTGKTFLIKHICKTLKSQNKVVAVTATTGIACCLYDSAQTIHRWSGIGDGRFHCKEIRQVIKNNVKFADVTKKIKNTDVLIIDECSMLSKNFFECLNEVCKLKDENQHFGGIQLLLSGDFRQLPPVPNPLYGEQGEFCFESNLFSKVLPHRITLTTVLRQSDTELIHAIHEVSIGNVSAETALFIESLQRP